MTGEVYKSDNMELQLVDGIVYAKYFINDFLDLDLAKNIVNERVSYTRQYGERFPILLDITQVYAESTREARKYWASREAAPDILAGAILTDNGMSRIGANIFFYVNKPEIPTQLFSTKDKEKAVKWLRKKEQELSNEAI